MDTAPIPASPPLLQKKAPPGRQLGGLPILNSAILTWSAISFKRITHFPSIDVKCFLLDAADRFHSVAPFGGLLRPPG
jgi:hypothetical protein